MSKLAFGAAGASGVAGTGAFAAYQMGLFSPEQLTVKEVLSREGYRVVKDDGKFKEFFKEFKSDTGFMNEVNKHKKKDEDLSNDDGDKGKVALKALCDSYLDSKDNLDKAIKWCVLRIQDTSLQGGKSWIAVQDNDSNKTEWETAFTNAKTKLIEYKVSGIDNSTAATTGYTHVKAWCSENKKQPINNKNKETLDNAVSWCTK
ncbi:hypothetical protein MHF_0405 [Mycoplasma haemofelis Ohio2]|uniref:Uncharacterized protein n=1 Tax=Mycoplasma haemofelis (strain Ohio2) TaxID=859194 RepID=F6FH76_MYCHI|nr:hypothetical protein MHF_0405 [Mycoplasma haemofelis Ohio2]